MAKNNGRCQRILASLGECWFRGAELGRFHSNQINGVWTVKGS